MLGLKVCITLFLGFFALLLLAGFFDKDNDNETKRYIAYSFIITIVGIIVIYIV